MEERPGFNEKLARECADAFWGATNLGCVISDSSGRVVKEYGYGCQSCEVCRALHKEKERCVQAQLYGMTEAERFGGRYIYYCPQGLTCFVSPILGEVVSEAKITVGPFLMVERQDYIACEMNDFAGMEQAQADTLRNILQKIPTVSTKRVQKLSTLLFMSVGFLNNVWAADQLNSQREANAIQNQLNSYLYELKNSTAQEYPIAKERALLQSIAKADKAEANRLLNELLGHILFSSGGDFETIKDRLLELLILMGRAAADGGADAQLMLQETARRRAELRGMHDVETLCLWLSRQMNTIMDSVFRYTDARHANAIHRCVQYIESHYFEKVTLEQLARMVYLTPSYLSRVFAKETGQPFNAYLNEVRIQKSKALLLHDGLRLADIAAAVGFEDQSYFTKVFKRSVGATPNKYRDKLKSKTAP